MMALIIQKIICNWKQLLSAGGHFSNIVLKERKKDHVNPSNMATITIITLRRGQDVLPGVTFPVDDDVQSHVFTTNQNPIIWSLDQIKRKQSPLKWKWKAKVRGNPGDTKTNTGRNPLDRKGHAPQASSPRVTYRGCGPGWKLNFSRETPAVGPMDGTKSRLMASLPKTICSLLGVCETDWPNIDNGCLDCNRIRKGSICTFVRGFLIGFRFTWFIFLLKWKSFKAKTKILTSKKTSQNQWSS